jgi:hypothetical protein
VCPHANTTTYASSCAYYCICIASCIRHSTICVRMLILLHMCPHAHTTTCVRMLILLHKCPHAHTKCIAGCRVEQVRALLQQRAHPGKTHIILIYIHNYFMYNTNVCTYMHIYIITYTPRQDLYNTNTRALLLYIKY